MELSFAATPEERRRRREVEERLAAAGLLLGPRRVELGEGGVPEDRVVWAAGLAAALADLGPVFAGFGRYLAHRGDLLTEDQCRALAGVAPVAPEGEEPGETVPEVVERELGAPPEELFARFEETPVRVGLLVQAHHAQRADGTPLRVRLVRPGVAALLDRDLAALPALERAWPGPRDELAALVAGYRRHLEAWLDGATQARALAGLALGDDGGELQRAPRVDPRGTGGRVLTVERLHGEALDAAAVTPPRRAALARRLCLWWLERALGGGPFPVEAEVEVLADGRLCPLAGCFAAPGGRLGRELSAYLRAAAGGERDAACVHLARAAGVEGPPPAELRRRMRQGVPFREGEDGVGLAHRLLLDWRHLRRCGVTAPRELEDVYRGLSWLTATAGRLDGGGDPLRDALEDLRWRGAWNELARLAAPERLLASLESYAEVASLLPQGLERALHDGAGPFAAAPRPPAAGRAASSTGGVALVLVLLAVGLATPPLAAALPAGAAVWAEAAGGGLFAVLAALLLLPRGGRR